MLRFVIPLIYQ